MPGPRPTPVRLQVLRGNPGQRRLAPTFEPPKPPAPPRPPPFLGGYALEEWNRVAPGLHLFGLLTEADIMVLAAYCESCQRWRTAQELLAEVALLDPKAHGLLVRGSKGQAKQNPLVQIMREAAGDMYRFACEFGFGPAARSRVAATTAIGAGEFEGLLGRH